MGTPYVGEIRMFAGNFAPAGWMFCNGQLLPISEYEVLFMLIGTTYGGDGQTTFALPNLQGRLPVHQTSGYAMGQAGGAESVTLTASTMTAHSHAFLASTDPGAQTTPSGNVAAKIVGGAASAYTQQAPTTPMAPNSIGNDGGSQPHDNMQPFLCISFIISMFGIFPSQS